MVKLKKGTWVVVADTEKALILENDGDARHPRLNVRRKESSTNPPDRTQSSDRPGRKNDGMRVQRSAMDETDWHELQKDRCAAQLADLLYDCVHAGHRQGIVLVAGAQTLGAIRAHLHQEVLQQIVAEIPKELSHQPVDQIASHVLDHLGTTA